MVLATVVGVLVLAVAINAVILNRQTEGAKITDPGAILRAKRN
jgi:hypothetical protein